MANRKKFSTRFWVVVIAAVIGLFSPSVLVATSNGDDYSEFDTFGKFCDRGGSASDS